MTRNATSRSRATSRSASTLPGGIDSIGRAAGIMRGYGRRPPSIPWTSRCKATRPSADFKFTTSRHYVGRLRPLAELHRTRRGLMMNDVHLDPLCKAETPLVRARRRDPSRLRKDMGDGGGGFARRRRLASRPLPHPGSTRFRDREIWKFPSAEAAFEHWSALTAAAYGELNAFANNIGLATKDRLDGAVLEAHAMFRRFGHVRALDGADFAVHAGESARFRRQRRRKSTLVKILSGADRPDEGQILLDGAPVVFNSPHDAQAHGIATVYQDLALAADLSPFENLFLGREIVRPGLLGQLGFINRAAMRRQAAEQFERLGVRLRSARASVSSLSGGRVSLSRSRAPRCGRTASSSWTSPPQRWVSSRLDACST